MHGLEADVTFLPLGVLRARLRRDRDGLGVLLIGMILLGTATFLIIFLQRLSWPPSFQCVAWQAGSQ